jgi:uncharacterized protein (TIGR03067 family)
MPYVLNPKTEPKSIDLIIHKVVVDVGIYKLAGDTLTLCIARDRARPTEFKSVDGVRLLILQRKK